MMRKSLLILGLVGLTAAVSAGDVFAQRRGSRGGWGNSPGISISVGRGGYYSPYGYYGGLGYDPYYRGYGYGYAPSYYDVTPSYSYYPATNYSEPQIRQAFYPAPAAAQQSVNVTVLVPTADAQVWFENGATSQRGMERLFHSPPLAPNQTFTYSIKVRWIENGRTVDQERRVNVQAGQNVTVNFRESARENVPPPLPQQPDAIPRK
jgi:uncharacterized protein (TIGR03000 family)